MRKLIFLILLFFTKIVLAEPIHIVAAENIYGSVAQQIGGEYVTVFSILNNPNQDPHLFNASHQTAIAIANANIAIANGAGYDSWAERLLAANTKKNLQIIIVAKLLHEENVPNPHLWYDPKTMPVFVKALTERLIALDPKHKKYFIDQLQKFNHDYHPLLDKISKMKAQYQNTPVTATEPIFNYMADALGLQMHGFGFQINVMNDVEPTPAQVKNFEDELRDHTIKVLIYNHQVGNPRTQHMQDIAQQVNIPAVGVSEMLPPEKTYVQWMLDELSQLEQALSAQHRTQ